MGKCCPKFSTAEKCAKGCSRRFDRSHVCLVCNKTVYGLEVKDAVVCVNPGRCNEIVSGGVLMKRVSTTRSLPL
jgi:hypothetical protein